MLGKPIDDEFGPPTLLKRLGNALEANLARERLASAGIPSFVAGPDAFTPDPFTSDRASPVAIYVPESLVADALDVLDQPPIEAGDSPDDRDAATWLDDPGRPLAFRALVASVAGWTIVFLTIVGLLLAVAAFAYAIALAVNATRRSTLRDRGLRLQVVAAIGLSVLGLAMSATLALYFATPR